MTDRLKTSLFDTLVPYGVAGARVLDLYAGSGALGIEMLSRGAEWADFVEHNAGVVRIIDDNLASTGLASRARVYKMAVGAFLAMRSKSHEQPHAVVDTAADYDIILLDPPYADPAINDTLETIAAGPLLAEDGILVIGHATQVHLAEEYGNGRLVRARQRVMGGSAFSIYERVAD
ncbi:MAG: rRNA (guanine966-N2)-methyltransferase [Chloroflexia bacterium]|jgi:16S rRNA (guanine(966)-N(2))-methyltransferase RsmD|nr:rRNA (guanine966-N2)-methyltransferase [Chloroflexia bacterium]